MKLIKVIAAASVLLSTTAFADQVFGTGAKMDKVMSISKVLEAPQSYMASPITIEGEVVKVCKKRGCWAELKAKNPSDKLTLKVRDGDMVFPMSAIGKKAYATGNITKKDLSLEQTIAYKAHLAEDGGYEFDPASVKKAMVLYRLAPTGVTIKY